MADTNNAVPPVQAAAAAAGPAPHPRTHKHSEHQSADNPPSFEQFLLSPGEQKIEQSVDTRTPNTDIFILNKEDHTLGNLFKYQLLKDPRVVFSGYRVPHPLLAQVELRIGTDGTCTPKEAFIFACEGITRESHIFLQEFTKECELRRLANAGAGKP